VEAEVAARCRASPWSRGQTLLRRNHFA